MRRSGAWGWRRGSRGAGRGEDSRGEARLYRQHQLYLDAGTHRNDGFKADWYPDPLVPFRHPLAEKELRGARLRAVPFDLPAGETQGFWVDVYVPERAAAGEYRGVYRLTAAGGGGWEVPVVLTVWDFALPATPTLVTEFGSPPPADYYERKGKTGERRSRPIGRRWKRNAPSYSSEHRINAVPPGEMLRPKRLADGSFKIPSEQVRAAAGIRGPLSCQRPAHAASLDRREGPGSRARRCGPGWPPSIRRRKSSGGPEVVFYTYLKDEPNTLDDYRYVQKWGRAVREAGRW